jgi:hypothetical protein
MDLLIETKKDLLHLKSELLDIKVELKFARLVRAAVKAGFNQDQPRDERGRWTDAGSISPTGGSEAGISFIQTGFADAQYAALSSGASDVLSDADPEPIIPGAQYAAANVVRNDRTGNPTIDKTTDRLIQTLDVVSETVGPGSGPYYGILVHTEFARSVRAQDLPGVGKTGVEQSFSMEDVARYGLDGTIRTDVVLRDPSSSNGTPIAVWDVKTGNARLSSPRVKQIRQYLGVGSEVPIIELHVTRGISNKQFKSRIAVYVTHRDAAEWWVPPRQRFTTRSLGAA